jgi:hypothetical protein
MPRILVLIAVCLVMTQFGCGPGRHLTIAGYTTEPPFDPEIRSVYIPTFKLGAFVTTPYRSLDVDITEAIVRELTSRKSPIRIVSDPARADTELVGTITRVAKNHYLYNVLGLPRDTEIEIRVDVVWRDLRSGKVLTNPAGPASSATAADQAAFDPSIAPALPPAPEGVRGTVTITGRGRMLPELGESNVTASNTASANLARQIVNLMERNW